MKTVRVAAGIIQRGHGTGEVLAVQRGYGSMAGMWEFPGGKIERGETAEDACKRELYEELKVRITNLRDFYTVEYDYPDFHLSMQCFFCSLAPGEGEPARSDRQQDIRWVPRRSLATLTWMPADTGLVEALSAGAKEEGPASTNAADEGSARGNVAGKGVADEGSTGEDAAAEGSAGSSPAKNAEGAASPSPATDAEGPAGSSPATDADASAPAGGTSTAANPRPRAAKRAKRTKRSRSTAKPGLLDGIDTSDLSASETELVRRRAAIRKSMQGNKRADTKPEMLVRQRLRQAGLTGYRLQWKQAPGRPDIAFPGRRIAIFVNGCFWHRCPHCNPSTPKRNVEFWEAKFRRNVERDARALAELKERGWQAIVIWECELKRDRIDATMERVVDIVRAAGPAARTSHSSASDLPHEQGPAHADEQAAATDPARTTAGANEA